MLYLLNLEFEKQEKVIKHDFYYSILWWFLSLFDGQDDIYNAIIKLSFRISKNFTISMGINGKENYNKVVTSILELGNKWLRIDSYDFRLKQLKFDFQIFDPSNVRFQDFKKFKLFFNSPTYIKSGKTNHLLPTPERFLYSAYDKLDKIYNFGIDSKEFKNWLKYYIIVWEYETNTQKITIKKSFKSGVRGFVTYYVNDDNEEFKKILYIALQGIKFVWVWTGVKLGCGNVGVSFR